MKTLQTPFNSQRIVKPAITDGSTLLVHSCFWTLQGEGPFSGHAAVFLRLAGCNLMCPFCDTEYTDGARDLEIAHIRDMVEGMRPPGVKGRKLLVITGGEPFRQNLAPFIEAMAARGWHTQIETNGVLTPQELDRIRMLKLTNKLTVVVSPKTSRVSAAIQVMASCYKYVLSADSVNPVDGLPYQALGNKCSPHVDRPDPAWHMPIYVNPMDSKDPVVNAANLRATAESCMRFGYICGTQLHKAIGLE